MSLSLATNESYDWWWARVRNGDDQMIATALDLLDPQGGTA